MTIEFNSKINTPTTGYRQILQEIALELKWLADEAGDYYTIDTLAKKYHLTNDEKYQRLKNSLILYFILEQYVNLPSIPEVEYNFVKQSIDKRYSSFIATIAKKMPAGFSLNGNIKVLTWNYDQQFELSVQNFLGKTIHEIKQEYNIHPNNISCDDKNKIIGDSKFELVKLNGNAAWDFLDGKSSWLTVFDKKLPVEDRLESFIEYYKNNKKNLDRNRQYFNFSWEALDDSHRNNYTSYKDVISEAEKIASETEILVVIGYSFPIFNRELDNRLFSKMENLNKIYIQDINPERIKSTMLNAFYFKNIHSQNVSGYEPPFQQIFLENSINQFVIPYELNQ